MTCRPEKLVRSGVIDHLKWLRSGRESGWPSITNCAEEIDPSNGHLKPIASNLLFTPWSKLCLCQNRASVTDKLYLLKGNKCVKNDVEVAVGNATRWRKSSVTVGVLFKSHECIAGNIVKGPER